MPEDNGVVKLVTFDALRTGDHRPWSTAKSDDNAK
jgi:hypothetical protein